MGKVWSWVLVAFFISGILPIGSIAQQKKWSLKECIDYAYKNNVALNQQILTNEVIKINYKQANENRLPNLNLNDVQGINFGNTVNSTTNQVIHQNTISNTPSLVSSVNLFNGLKLINLVKEARQNYEASKLDIETQKNNLALNVTAAYEQILFEYEAVTIAEHQVETDSVQVKRMELFVSVGQSPEDSLYLIKAQLAIDRSAVVTAQTQVDLSNLQLEQLMEMPIIQGFAIEQPEKNEISPNIAIDAADIYKIAENNLPDIHSAELKTKAYETDLLVNKAALLPTLTLNGGLTTEYFSALSPQMSYQTKYLDETIGYVQNIPTENVVGPVSVTTSSTRTYGFFRQYNDNFSQYISFSLNVPIFNYYKARNNIQLSKIAIENAKLNEQAVKNTLRKNVETAYTNQVAGSKNYIATREQLTAETKAYTDMRKKYNVGLASTTDYLVEENNYYKAVIANLQAKYEYIFETKVVDFYTGKPLTK